MEAGNTAGIHDKCPGKNFGICASFLKIIDQEARLRSLTQVSLSAKQYLYHQGDELRHDFYILQKGWILLKHVTEKGRQQVVRLVLPGDILGFQPDRHEPSIHSAILLQDSVVCCVADLKYLCNRHPELALDLARSEACEAILSELYMVNIAHQDARGKIAFMILEIYQRLKTRGLIDGFTFSLPLNQEDIAEMLGLTAVHVNRTLHKMRQENLLVLQKHKLTILDYDRLSALAGQELQSLQICNLAMRDGRE